MSQELSQLLKYRIKRGQCPEEGQLWKLKQGGKLQIRKQANEQDNFKVNNIFMKVYRKLPIKIYLFCPWRLRSLFPHSTSTPESCTSDKIRTYFIYIK
jgi:hypothetical protein